MLVILLISELCCILLLLNLILRERVDLLNLFGDTRVTICLEKLPTLQHTRAEVLLRLPLRLLELFLICELDSGG